ncbi:MAG TPA: OsmC family protein [Thermomicrobiales bacterium]
MTVTQTLRERQAPLKERYQQDPESARLTITVRSTTSGDDPTRSRITTEAGGGVSWDVGAHPYAGGVGDVPCSGDLLLASLAACQEITLRMVAAAMGITLKKVDVTVHGDMDFRGTMGIDPETPVGFQRIRTEVRIVADAPPERLERLKQRAERYCVVASTLRQSPVMELSFAAEPPAE